MLCHQQYYGLSVVKTFSTVALVVIQNAIQNK